MNLKKLLFMILLPLVISCSKQIQNYKTELVKISGNCEMCKATIERAGSLDKTSSVLWDKDLKSASISYDSLKSSRTEILKKIALAGYDNQEFIAPDDAYNKLPDCCKYIRSKPIAEEKDEIVLETDTIKKDTVIAEQQQEQINRLEILFDQYFEIKDALIGSNSSKTATKAKELNLSISSLPLDELTDSERKVFLECKTGLLFEAEHIMESNSLDHQRDHFSSLSELFYKLAKSSMFNETIYYQNCPMFADGKGANWLSKEDKVKNPYYGSSMLSCGRTIETIK